MDGASSTRSPTVSICSLPPEVLCRVFEFLVDIEPPRSSSLQGRQRSFSVAGLRPVSHSSAQARRNTLLAVSTAVPDRLGWYRITHVCRYFRSTALAYPALWGTVPFALGSNWAYLALERSQSADLVVRHAIYPGTRGSDLLTHTNFLFDIVDRVRVFELSGAQETLGAVLARLNRSASRLQTLSMQADRVSGPNEDWPFTIPRTLFKVDAPNIRELRLDGVFISALPDSIPTLNHLSICLRQSRREYPRTRDVYILLRAAPNLETVVLKHCLPQTVDGVLEPVHLPVLRSIELVDADSAITGFMRTTVLTSITLLDAQCSMTSIPEEDEVSRAQTLIASCVARSSSPLSMTFSSDGRGVEVSLSSPRQEKPNVYLFILPSNQPVWDFGRLLYSAFGAVPTSLLQEVTIHLPAASSADDDASWRELPQILASALDRFEELRSLSTSRVGWATCVALVGALPDALSPRLQELTLAKVDFFEPIFWDSTLASVARSRKGVLRKLRLVGSENLGRETLITELRTLLEVEVVDSEPFLVEPLS